MLPLPDPVWIEELLKSNCTPSAQAAQEVTDMLLEPSKELEDIDEEILNLINRLEDLKGRRTEIQKRIIRYKSILAPIRRVPMDVLGEIFYHCLPTLRDPIMSSSESPLLLTRVSSPWRDAAMRTPKLWDRLYIPFTDDDTLPDRESLAELGQDIEMEAEWEEVDARAVNQHKTEILRRRYDAVREWLARSGTRPLYLSLHITSALWYAILYSERPPNITKEFLSYLASLAPRWKRFEIRSSMRMYKALENLLPLSQMKELMSFRVEYSHRYQEWEDPHQPPRLLNAPNLRQVSISVRDNGIWGVAHHKLTRMTCINHSFSIDKIIFLLKHAFNLVHFKGTILQHSLDYSPAMCEGPISLLSLQSLSITESLHPLFVTDMYHCIEAPKLKWVTYVSHFSGHMNNPAPIPILPLLRRLTQLQYLCVDGSNLGFWDLGIMLHAVPSVTDLAIGKEDIYLSPSDPSIMMWPPFYAPHRQGWSFNELIVERLANKRGNNAPLVPLLTSLTISSQSTRISDDTLFELIRSRMTPSAPTAPLKHVRGVFQRLKEKDIVPDLARYAEGVGVEMIDLDLSYAQPPPSVVNSTSPESGLIKRRDGPSWIYEDAGDTTFMVPKVGWQ